jgi:hypothetical protein
MKEKNSERKGIAQKVREEKTHAAQIKELTD